VAVQKFAAGRSPQNFHRPDEFLPQRWQGRGEFANDRQGASQPFSIGPRNCIGRELAYTEVRLILVHLLWHFNIRPGGPGTDWLAEQGVWILWDKKPLWAVLERRSTGQKE
jgi:averantin hydroxylase